MNYWWVNQNQTYVHEVGGGYLSRLRDRLAHHRAVVRLTLCHYPWAALTTTVAGRSTALMIDDNHE